MRFVVLGLPNTLKGLDLHLKKKKKNLKELFSHHLFGLLIKS